jgi:hypothetical protein
MDVKIKEKPAFISPEPFNSEQLYRHPLWFKIIILIFETCIGQGSNTRGRVPHREGKLLSTANHPNLMYGTANIGPWKKNESDVIRVS